MNKDPIERYASVDDIPEWFWNEVADDSRTIKDEDCAIHRIETALNRPGLLFNRKDRTLTVVSKEEYFREQYGSFIEQVKRFTDISLKDFADGTYVDMWNMDQSYEEKFGTYMFFNEDLITLDELIRQSDNGDRYHTGSLLDYHY